MCSLKHCFRPCIWWKLRVLDHGSRISQKWTKMNHLLKTREFLFFIQWHTGCHTSRVMVNIFCFKIFILRVNLSSSGTESRQKRVKITQLILAPAQRDAGDCSPLKTNPGRGSAARQKFSGSCFLLHVHRTINDFRSSHRGGHTCFFGGTYVCFLTRVLGTQACVYYVRTKNPDELDTTGGDGKF